jgi:hypothetical protein
MAAQFARGKPPATRTVAGGVLSARSGGAALELARPAGRVFNINGNDYRLVAAVQYRAAVLAIRFFGSHAEYDRIDAETV